MIALAAAVSALAATAAVPQPEGEVLLRFEQRKADQIVFRFWVPIDQVRGLYPDRLSPAMPRRSSGEPAAPAGMVDCYLALRQSSFSYPLDGQTVEERQVLDGYLLLAAEVPPALNPGGAQFTTILLEYYCGSETLASLLRGAGLPLRTISGRFEAWLRADSQQMIEGAVTAEGHGEWRFRVVTSDLRHFDTGRAVMRTYFTVGGELRALDIEASDDFYMRAVGDIVFEGDSPLDNLQRIGGGHVRYHYSTGNTHLIRRIK